MTIAAKSHNPGFLTDDDLLLDLVDEHMSSRSSDVSGAVPMNGLGKRPVAIDLYAGVGGLSLGIKQAGFDVVAAVEADSRTARYYRYNHPKTRVVTDQVGPAIEERLAETIPAGTELALVVGGPPCQGFSWAGRRRADDRRNREVVRFARMVLALRPLAFVMENVRGILSNGMVQLSTATRALSAVYAVGEPQILVASDYGVPQARERVFLVGIRRDVGTVPEDIQPVEGACPTVLDAIGDLPTAPPGEPGAAFGVSYASEPESQFAKEMRGHSRSEDDWHDSPRWDDRFCTNAVLTRHSRTVRRRFKGLAVGEQDPISRLQRLDPNGVAVTIRAGTPAEYGSRSAPRPVHPIEHRVLTTRECARLQSFPDWYLFHPTKWHGNQQVGNAVPPMLAKALGHHLCEALCLQPGRLRSENPVERDYTQIAEDFKGAPWLPDVVGPAKDA